MKSAAGFTLVELVTVLALIAIVTGIAMPRIDFENARVRATANTLVTTLVAAQSRAVLNQHDVAVVFDTTGGSALVHLDADNDGTVDAGETTQLVEFEEGVRYGSGGAPNPPGGGAATTFTQLHSGAPSVTFHRNGSASQTGVLSLVAGSATAVSPDPAHVRSIEVSRPTGRAVCRRLIGGSWEASC